MAGARKAILHCVEHRGMENSKLGNFFSIVAQISMLETGIITLRYPVRYTWVMSSLLECYSIAGH